MNRLVLSARTFPVSQCWLVIPARRFAAKAQNPFKVLGLSEDCSYADVKTAFLKIAMEHHPDRLAKTASEEDQIRARDTFVKARHAFESLKETDEGGAITTDEQMENFEDWFKDMTGHDTPFQFMDRETMKEVAEMEETVGHGLDRDGGMWTLAAMVSNAVKDGKDGTDLLKLEAGEVKHRDHIDGVLRRKRRPRR